MVLLPSNLSLYVFTGKYIKINTLFSKQIIVGIATICSEKVAAFSSSYLSI